MSKNSKTKHFYQGSEGMKHPLLLQSTQVSHHLKQILFCLGSNPVLRSFWNNEQPSS